MPAGTITEAVTAFRAGADAVYFGMKDFSARKGAGNFSASDLSRIRRYAIGSGRKIYVTVNTLVDDESLPRLYEVLKTIDSCGCDGVIVQDLGAAAIIRRDFPALPLHGSTQLAVHTAGGVKELQALGFERVVLSRELNLDEIRAIRTACPDIELKVFIHGALCYGFSGLCMASHLITGRSANEGGCAQICRSWFTDRDTGKRYYPFSLEDLDAGLLVRELMDIGIDSLKVEGRLKGPEYVDAVTRYYRAIIDGKDEKPYRHAVAVSFQRKAGHGFLEPLHPGRGTITTGPYPGHRGEKIGRVIDQRGRKLLVETSRRIKPHDGMMVLIKDNSGKTTLIKLANGLLAPTGGEICIDGHFISVTAGGITESYECSPEPSEKSADGAITSIFSQSGDYPFRLSPIVIDNRTGMDTFYINPSRLKAVRRDFMPKLAESLTDTREYSSHIENTETGLLPPRETLDGERTPWNMDGVEINGNTYLSFPAVRYDENDVFRRMEKRAGEVVSPVIGLNNIGDVIFAKAHPQYSYFADIYLYLPNREAAALLKEEVPSLVGGYLWVERESCREPWPFTPTPASGYRPPLFISRSCYRHDGLGLSCSGCTRHSTFRAEQNGRNYIVFCDECNTIVREDQG